MIPLSMTSFVPRTKLKNIQVRNSLLGNMLNFENISVLVAATFVFASALTSKISTILEKYGLKSDKQQKKALIWFVFSSLLLLTGYFYVAYLLLLHWPS